MNYFGAGSGHKPPAGPAPLSDLPNTAAAKAAYVKTARVKSLPTAALGRLGGAVGDAILFPAGVVGHLHPALRTPGQQAAWAALPDRQEAPILLAPHGPERTGRPDKNWERVYSVCAGLWLARG